MKLEQCLTNNEEKYPVIIYVFKTSSCLSLMVSWYAREKYYFNKGCCETAKQITRKQGDKINSLYRNGCVFSQQDTSPLSFCKVEADFDSLSR